MRMILSFRPSVFLLTLVFLLYTPNPALGLPLWDTLSQGIKLFSQFVSFNPDSPITPIFKFVSERLIVNPTPKKGDPEENDEESEGDNKDFEPWSSLFRTLGFTKSQMGSFTVDLLIFLAQMVNNAFSDGRVTKRRGKSMTKPLIETIIEQPRISRMLSTMQDPKLMDHVLLEVDGRLADSDSDCPQQLLCRMSPIVKGMQTSLAFFLKEKVFQEEKVQKGETGQPDREKRETQDMSTTWRSLTPIQRLLFFMPSYQDFMNEGEPCRRRFSKCGSQ